jgi:acetyl-CoA synthetase
VVAYVRLKPGIEWTRDLEVKLRVHVSNRVSSIATPQDIRVIDMIPKNKSGKIMRRVLKAWYTGKDAGDLSTLEE